MTTNPFLVEPFRFPNVHGRVGGDGGGNGGGRGGGGEGPVPSPKRIRSREQLSAMGCGASSRYVAPQITKDELAKALTSLEMDASEEAVMQMMQRIDKDSSGTITLDEFSSIVAWQLQLLANGLGSRKSLVAES